MSESLFQPIDPGSSATFRLLRRINQLYAQNLESYHDLYNWSCCHLDLFWALVWTESHIIGEMGSRVIDKSALPVHNPTW